MGGSLNFSNQTVSSSNKLNSFDNSVSSMGFISKINESSVVFNTKTSAEVETLDLDDDFSIDGDWKSRRQDQINEEERIKKEEQEEAERRKRLQEKQELEKKKAEQQKEKKEKSGLWSFTETLCTVVDSCACFVKGAADVAENVVDGGLTAIAWGASVVGADEFSKSVTDFVKTDVTQVIYDEVIEDSWVGENSQLSDGAKKGFEIVGTIAATTALNSIPGGQIATAVVAGFAAAGASEETALNNGASLNEAMVCGTVAFGTSTVSRFALGSINLKASSSINWVDVAKCSAASLGVSEIEPVVNGFTSYITYGQDMKDESGNSLTMNEYFKSTGTYTNMLVSGVAGTASTAISGTKSVIDYNKVSASAGGKAYKDSLTDTIDSKKKWEYKNDTGTELTETPDYLSQVQKEVDEAFDDTYRQISRQKYCGVYKKDVSKEEVFSYLTNGQDARNIMHPKIVSQWNKNWNIDPDTGKAEVVALKSNSDYNNYCQKNGSFGREDGEFVIPKNEADRVLNNCKNADGSIDCAKVAKELCLPEGTFASGVTAVYQTVNGSDIKIPTSDLGGAMPGYWLPGGNTRYTDYDNDSLFDRVFNRVKGNTEGVIPHAETSGGVVPSSSGTLVQKAKNGSVIGYSDYRIVNY